VTTPDLSLVRQMDNAQEGYRPVAGEVLSVDVERARAVVGELQETAAQVMSLWHELSTTQVLPPAQDEVSRNAAIQAGRMLVAARAYLTTWHDDLLAGIEALSRQIDSYQLADQRNASRA